MSKTVNILSLFGGIECGRVAIERLGWEVGQYFSSEHDPYPQKIASDNYPDIIHLGDVQNVRYYDRQIHSSPMTVMEDGKILVNQSHVVDIDIIIGGPPCQDLSSAKKDGKGLEGEKSSLFFEYVRILREVKPKYFLMENVASMKKSDKEKITNYLLEIYPDTVCHFFDSNVVSAQNRKRLYWTNIPGMTQPEDKGIRIIDILEDIPLDDPRWILCDEKQIERLGKERIEKYMKREKMETLTATYNGAIWWNSVERSQRPVQIKYINGRLHWRKYTPIEAERAQTLPDDYTKAVSKTRRLKAIGNGWTVDIIKHILSHCKF